MSKFPALLKVKNILANAGAKGVLMSGSGSSIFGLYPDYKTAKRAYNYLLRNEKWQVYVTKLLV